MKTQKQPGPDAADDFKAVCNEAFGKSLSDEEVRYIARRLLKILQMMRQALSDSAAEEDPAEHSEQNE